jgi:hypothetical protein
MDGAIVFAANGYNDAFKAINVPADCSSPIGAGPVWTGTGANGVGSDNTCGDWMTSAGTATVGNVGSTGAAWTEDATLLSCGLVAHLYCFEL